MLKNCHGCHWQETNEYYSTPLSLKTKWKCSPKYIHTHVHTHNYMHNYVNIYNQEYIHTYIDLRTPDCPNNPIPALLMRR